MQSVVSLLQHWQSPLCPIIFIFSRPTNKLLPRPSGGLGLTGGIADVGSLHDALAGIHADRVADPDAILDVYDAQRRRIWHDVIDPISSDNMRRLYSYETADEAVARDPLLAMLKGLAAITAEGEGEGTEHKTPPPPRREGGLPGVSTYLVCFIRLSRVVHAALLWKGMDVAYSVRGLRMTNGEKMLLTMVFCPDMAATARLYTPIRHDAALYQDEHRSSSKQVMMD